MNKSIRHFLFAFISCLLIFCVSACSSNKIENTKDSAGENSNNNTTSSTSINTNNISGTTTKSSQTNSNNNTTSNSVTNSNSVTTTNSTSTSTTNSSYSDKLEKYLDGAVLSSNTITTKLKELGEYVDNSTLATNAIFASPNGNGTGDSIANCCNLQDALDQATSGQTVYLKGGIYSASNLDGFYVETKGTPENYITIRNYPGEKPVISNTHSGNGTSGFQLSEKTCYTIIEGIEFANIIGKSCHGIVTWGNIHHIIIRNCSFHDIKTNVAKPDTDYDCGSNGILLFGESLSPIYDIAIYKNICKNNINGWCENISVTANCEYVYVLENTVTENTNIGIDFYGNAEGYCTSPELNQPRYCLAAGNYISQNICSYADCAGLYVDGARDIVLQQNTIKNNQYGIEVGSEERNDKYPVKNITVRNNVCESNTICGIRVGGYETTKTGVVYSTNIINNSLINNSGSQFIIAKVDGINYFNNAVITKSTNALVSTDFNSTYTKNVKFDCNYFYVEGKTGDSIEFNLYQSSQIGIQQFNQTANGTNYFNNFTIDSNYSIPSNSPLINKGIICDYGKFDFFGKTRISGNKVDIGAVEF